MAIKICQYASCMEEIGENGVSVTLLKETPYYETRAVYCCASHAAAGLSRLALDRHEEVSVLPTRWKHV
jgi:hypothetical protein